MPDPSTLNDMVEAQSHLIAELSRESQTTIRAITESHVRAARETVRIAAAQAEASQKIAVTKAVQDMKFAIGDIHFAELQKIADRRELLTTRRTTATSDASRRLVDSQIELLELQEAAIIHQAVEQQQETVASAPLTLTLTQTQPGAPESSDPLSPEKKTPSVMPSSAPETHPPSTATSSPSPALPDSNP